MILRWTAPDGAQHYLDGLTHIAVLGVWGHDDGKVGADYTSGNTVRLWVVDFARLWDEAKTNHWAEPDRGVVAFVKTDGRDGPTVEQIDCVWMAVLNDRGDTIDQLVRRNHVAIANAAAPSRHVG